METLFIVCAILGGTLLVCQFVLSLLGVGGHHDMDGHHDFGGPDVSHGDAHAGHHGGDHDHHGNWFVGVLTFRSLVAAVTFFGLGGLAASGGERAPLLSLAVALATGLGALYLVGSVMRALHKLRAEGTFRYERAVGATGTVYLTVPAKKAGAGKVTLTVQNRTVECQAITSEGELPTGAKIVVVNVVSPGTVEVAPAP